MQIAHSQQSDTTFKQVKKKLDILWQPLQVS